MSEHCGYVCKLSNVRPHPNADRMKLATVFGNTICVGLNNHNDEVGIYFPTDIQLSEEFCRVNDLVRRKDENGKQAGGYLDPVKRNVRTIKLRGAPSDGMWLPVKCLDYCYKDGAEKHLSVGDTIDIVEGHPICQKYIPAVSRSTGRQNKVSRTRKAKTPIAPMFREHADTEQLAYNLAAFNPCDEVEITLKMHGTSARTGYLPVLKGYKRTFWDKLFKRLGTPIYDWGYVTGTRRTICNTFEGGYYGNDEFREIHAKELEGKLHKGETIYGEIVGFITNGTPIMASVANAPTNDKDFIKQYGDTTIFSYGCFPNGKKRMHGSDDVGNYFIEVDAPQSEFYAYRMTMTNEDGDVVEYTPDFMRYRCEQMGVKYVMPFEHFIIPDANTLAELHLTAGEYVQKKAEEYYDGPDPIGKTHVRKGVVCRIINRPSFTAYKIKNLSFKIIEGIAKNDASAPDMEEAQDVVEE